MIRYIRYRMIYVSTYIACLLYDTYTHRVIRTTRYLPLCTILVFPIVDEVNNRDPTWCSIAYCIPPAALFRTKHRYVVGRTGDGHSLSSYPFLNIGSGDLEAVFHAYFVVQFVEPDRSSSTCRCSDSSCRGVNLKVGAQKYISGFQQRLMLFGYLFSKIH